MYRLQSMHGQERGGHEKYGKGNFVCSDLVQRLTL